VHQQNVLVCGGLRRDEIVLERKARPQHAIMEPPIFLRWEYVVAKVQVVPGMIDKAKREHPHFDPVQAGSDCSAVTTATL
jgi:hypothetical protein